MAVDPGCLKCGLAVIDTRDGILARGVVPAEVVGMVVQDWVEDHAPHLLVLGKGTASRRIRTALSQVDLPLKLVPEARTTLRARDLYFQENPPRGWRRLIPRGLQVPPVPIDDYAAVVIAEDYLASLK
jgi:RNase H-fold protein (predicted Holliday junction resolvase)